MQVGGRCSVVPTDPTRTSGVICLVTNIFTATTVGVSYQTGCTGLVAGLIEIVGNLDAQTILQAGTEAVFSQKNDGR